jgi:ferrochelatase
MNYDSLILQSFGGPEGPEDVMPFLKRVTAGRNIPDDRLSQVAEHYLHFGGVSPINAQNRELIAAIEKELACRGLDLPVYFGNRNWHPFLEDTVSQMARDGRRSALSLVTSAFGSSSSCRQYLDDIDRAAASVGLGAPSITKIRLYYDHPGFIDAAADRVRLASRQLSRSDFHLAFTAHSIPCAMPGADLYLDQLGIACALVAERLNIPPERFSLSFQSRSGPPNQPWLEPDIGQRLRELAADQAGTGSPGAVVIFPIGFVSDHMEVLFDLDTEAMVEANQLGLEAIRAKSVGTHPRFVAMVVDLVEEYLFERAPTHLSEPPWPPARCTSTCCRRQSQ